MIDFYIECKSAGSLGKTDRFCDDVITNCLF